MLKDKNSLLLDAIKSRSEKSAEFNSGILTADRYVKTLSDCVGSDLCYRYASTKAASFSDSIKRAEGTLTYNNPEMVVVDIYSDFKKQFETEHEIELPKDTLMVFKHILTTSRKDRDGDIMRTSGAKPDPKMLLLWQHVHTLPIGKMLKITEHTKDRLEVITAIIDINELAHDSAVMIDNKMGRFSHGFRALSFTDMKEESGVTTSSGGFDVKEFEIMEESLVSVPANPDAEQQEILLDLIEGDKLSSSMMKSFGKNLRSKQTTTTSAGGFVESKDGKIETKAGCGCGGSKEADPTPGAGSSPEKTDAADKPEDSKDKKVSNDCPYCSIPVSNGRCPECNYAPSEQDKGTVSGVKGGNAKGYYGSISGSWESVQEALRDSCKTFCKEKGLFPNTDDKEIYSYAWIISTDSSKAIICVESEGISKYYQAAYEIDATSVAKFAGQPKEVMIRFSADIIEKSKRMSRLSGLKAGKTLSKDTLETIKEIESDLEEIHEHCSTRSGKALCKKAAGTVKALITQAEAAKPPEGELKPTPGGEGLLSMQAAATFLAKSTSEERVQMLKILEASCQIDKQVAVTSSIRKTVAGLKS